MGAAGSLQASQRRLSYSQRRLSSQHTKYSPDEAAMFSPSASGPCQQVIRKVIAHRLQAAEKQGGTLTSLTDDLTAALLAAAPHVVAAFGEEAAIGAATGAYTTAAPAMGRRGAADGVQGALSPTLDMEEDEAAALAARTRTQIAARREDAHWKAHEADQAEKRTQAGGGKNDGCGGPGHEQEQEQSPVQIASETPAVAASSTAKLTSSTAGAAAGTVSPQTATRDGLTTGDLIQEREKVLETVVVHVSSEGGVEGAAGVTQPELVAAGVAQPCAQQPETTAERKARKMALRYHDSSGSASEGGSFRASSSVHVLGNDAEPAGGEKVNLGGSNTTVSTLTPEQQRKSRRMSSRYR